MTTLFVDAQLVGRVNSGNQTGTVPTPVAAEMGGVKQLIRAKRPVVLQSVLA